VKLCHINRIAVRFFLDTLYNVHAFVFINKGVRMKFGIAS